MGINILVHLVNVIRCPVCRQEFMDVDVMENFFLRDSVEMSSSTVDKPFQVRDTNTTTTLVMIYTSGLGMRSMKSS